MSLLYQRSIRASQPTEAIQLARKALPPTNSLTKNIFLEKFFIHLILISSGVKDHLKTKEDKACPVDINSFNKLNH